MDACAFKVEDVAKNEEVLEVERKVDEHEIVSGGGERACAAQRKGADEKKEEEEYLRKGIEAGEGNENATAPGLGERPLLPPRGENPAFTSWFPGLSWDQTHQKVEGVCSSFRGVTWDERAKRWTARIKYKYKQTHLGSFGSEKEAALAFNAAVGRLGCPASWLNGAIGEDSATTGDKHADAAGAAAHVRPLDQPSCTGADMLASAAAQQWLPRHLQSSDVRHDDGIAATATAPDVPTPFRAGASASGSEHVGAFVGCFRGVLSAVKSAGASDDAIGDFGSKGLQRPQTATQAATAVTAATTAAAAKTPSDALKTTNAAKQTVPVVTGVPPTGENSPGNMFIKQAQAIPVVYKEPERVVARAERRQSRVLPTAYVEAPADKVGGEEEEANEIQEAEEKQEEREEEWNEDEADGDANMATPALVEHPLPPSSRELGLSSSRFQGVTWSKEVKKWKAYKYIGTDGHKKSIHLGTYADEEAAAQAVVDYDERGTVPARKATSSNFRGVSWAKVTKKWQAHISDKGKTILLGTYCSEKEAALAYNVAVRQLGRPTSWLNDIGEVGTVDANTREPALRRFDTPAAAVQAAAGASGASGSELADAVTRFHQQVLQAVDEAGGFDEAFNSIGVAAAGAAVAPATTTLALGLPAPAKTTLDALKVAAMETQIQALSTKGNAAIAAVSAKAAQASLCAVEAEAEAVVAIASAKAAEAIVKAVEAKSKAVIATASAKAAQATARAVEANVRATLATAEAAIAADLFSAAL